MADVDLTGQTGSISWTAGLTGGSSAPEEDRVVLGQFRITRQGFPTTRPQSLMQRVCPSEWRGGGVLRIIVTDDGIPPVPINTVGTLRIFTKTAATAQHYTFKVIILGIGSIGYNSLTGQPQFQDYECQLCSTSTSDTVVGT